LYIIKAHALVDTECAMNKVRQTGGLGKRGVSVAPIKPKESVTPIRDAQKLKVKTSTLVSRLFIICM
jgi:hypothetical protein